MGKKPPHPETTILLAACWPPSNTPMPGPTTLTTPKNSSIGSRTSTQLGNKVPIGYHETPQIHSQNCPFPFDDHHPIYNTHPSTDPTHHFKWHPFSCFATVHFPDRQTRRQTNRWSRQQVSKNTMYARYTDREWRANKEKELSQAVSAWIPQTLQWNTETYKQLL